MYVASITTSFPSEAGSNKPDVVTNLDFNIQANTEYKVKVEVSENTFTSKCRIFNASHACCLFTSELIYLATGEYIYRSNSDATENQNRLTNSYIFRFQTPAETGTIKFKIKVLENTI